MIRTFILLFFLVAQSLAAQQKQGPQDTVAVKGVEDTVQVKQTEPLRVVPQLGGETVTVKRNLDTVSVQQTGPVTVEQVDDNWRAIFRLYIVPGLGTVFLGICALLLVSLRVWVKEIFRRWKAENEAKMKQDQANAELKQQQDRKFQELLTETNARALVAAANAAAAAERAERLGDEVKRGDEQRTRLLEKVVETTERTEHNTNSALEKALRQVERLSQQIMDKGERPQKGNGG